jgi:hypothetical protein
MLSFLDQTFMQYVVLFTPVHQALLEVFKQFGLRARQYWEALAYIVYGEDWAKGGRRWTFTTHVPNSIGTIGKEWANGPQGRLIESFLLRSVGDTPSTDLSDADIANTARVARLAAGHAGRVGGVLDDLVRVVPRSSQELVRVLEALQEDGGDRAVNEQLRAWADLARDEPDVSPARLLVWRAQFNQKFLPGVIRAEVELPNALKSAEYRYHWYLRWASMVLAAIEGLVIAAAWAFNPFAWLVAAGLLFVFPQATKSLTDALVGIGKRFRF